MVFQDPFAALNPRKRIIDTIAIPMIYHGLTTKHHAVHDISKLMELVGLTSDALYRYPHEFSGGQRQRICIAKALSLKPKLLIADEPTSALDVSIQAQILNLLKSLQHELDLTNAVFDHPLHDYTKALLAASPKIDPTLARNQKPLLNGEVTSNRYIGKDARKRMKGEVSMMVEPLTWSNASSTHGYAPQVSIRERMVQ